MRQAKVFYKGLHAGTLTQSNTGNFTFSYTPAWLQNPQAPPISLTLPKYQNPFASNSLFPFFYNFLPEDHNRKTICRLLKIDENDHFGILLHSAKNRHHRSSNPPKNRLI